MGSAKQPETLQFLKQEAVPEDAHQPSSSSPCSPEKDRCLQNLQCDGHLAMRNCCINDLTAKESSQDNTMVDNPNHKENAPAANPNSSVDGDATTGTVTLKDTGVGGILFEMEGEKTASHDLCHNSKQKFSLTELPGSPTNTCSPQETKASPVSGEICRNLSAESCLKGASKDLASTPSSSKHVAFLEPSKNKDEAESVKTGTGHSEAGPVLPACLKNRSQGQPCSSSGDIPHFSHDIYGTAKHLNEGHRDASALGAIKESVAEPSRAETTLGKSGKPVTESNQLGQRGEIRSVALDTKSGGDCSVVLEVPVAVISHDVQPQGLIPGQLQGSLGEASKEKEGLRETIPADARGQNKDHEQQRPEAGSTATCEEHKTAVEIKHMELLAKTCSLEVTPSQHDAGTQADNRVSLVSVAISPINPPDGSTAFTFHARGLGAPSLTTPEQKPTKKDVEMQVSIPVETRSVATGPMTPITKSPQASYPEVHVKGAQEETPEPVREVSWDEKGMTWEVYGASMEVEVLGMAIQKHLEKQIEEHGRQTVMTPQSTRSSSIKGPPHKGEIKRQPSMFRALLQNVRRPRCCSRGGPAVE
ncbi:G protein-regulated inducer of neurite outgrowth 1 [Sceloporus undulatus]|uniref:G protein-regulated inducer of neurite outgrowth 1 n=1 Tax=Sceloporus undulatus TaxID=8520 RepID=UPI001C4C6512|nr:G protein-regulated inducer of neurite outgrowth 1 [Sceloporus undulatus]XP_042303440.1 G protein-regulated inducer of neurite outgrowth 1 [Sceloporus undulatus]